jgi:hypothetical protein
MLNINLRHFNVIFLLVFKPLSNLGTWKQNIIMTLDGQPFTLSTQRVQLKNSTMIIVDVEKCED